MNISLNESYNEVLKQAQARHVQEYKFYMQGLHRCGGCRSILCRSLNTNVGKATKPIKLTYCTPSYALQAHMQELLILLKISGFIQHVLIQGRLLSSPQ